MHLIRAPTQDSAIISLSAYPRIAPGMEGAVFSAPSLPAWRCLPRGNHPDAELCRNGRRR